MNSKNEVFSLDGEIVMITGGGSGIGLAMAKAMHEAGAALVLVGRREQELADACASLGDRAFYEVYDVTCFDQAESMVERVRERVGVVTCLVNNAGIHVKKWAQDTEIVDFQSVLNTHVLGAHALVRAVAPQMVQRGGGSILFTASMASLFGIPQVIAYSAAKSAHVGMVRTLATELSPKGVRVNAIAPGWIETEMSRKAMDSDPTRRDRILERTPMGRFGKVEDIGWAAVYLASPAARFVTGVVLPIDGGISIGF